MVRFMQYMVPSSHKVQYRIKQGVNLPEIRYYEMAGIDDQ